ncbi:hypothetical protein [Streptomyces sp. NPDC057616]|uniref:hypothetical protein n=1 Tax=Streptomyces sp. NPDC057616 TaxID=3346183 RepID=UPI0036919399
MAVQQAGKALPVDGGVQVSRGTGVDGLCGANVVTSAVLVQGVGEDAGVVRVLAGTKVSCKVDGSDQFGRWPE